MNKKKTNIKKFQKNQNKTDGRLFRYITLIVSVILMYLIFVNRSDLQKFSQYGYIGIFVVNFISAATILLPLPGTASVFIGGAVWNPIIVGIVSGLGSAMGELFAYFLGYGGRGFLKSYEDKNDWVKKIEKKFMENGFRTTFIFALLPLPFFDVIGLIAGALNYPVWKFFIAMVSARVIRNIVFAFTGTFFD